MRKLVVGVAGVALTALSITGCASSGSDAASEDAALLQAQQGLDGASPLPSPTWTMMPSDDDMGSMMNDDEASSQDSAIGQLDSGERQFIVDMIPHHQQAVDMSTLALTRAKDPKVVNLATAILANQAKEISMMTGWVGPADDDAAGHHGMNHHGMGHSDDDAAMAEHGMLTDAQMEQLRTVKGAAFDKLFLTGMIAHHQGAVTMSKPHTTSANTTLANFAKAIIKDQTAEITQMQAMLAGL